MVIAVGIHLLIAPCLFKHVVSGRPTSRIGTRMLSDSQNDQMDCSGRQSSFGWLIVARLMRNPRLMLHSYPEDVRAVIAPKTSAEMCTSWSATFRQRIRALH
jgi:hypothetical protein